jgi:hypothetical protein
LDLQRGGEYQLMAKEPFKSRIPPNVKSVAEDRKAELRRKAQLAVKAEQDKASEDAFYEQVLAEERRALIPAERLETLTLDFAPFMDKVTINGDQHFWHGSTVTVPASVAAVLREQMFRSWQHQDHVEGKDRMATYQRQRNTVLSARHGVISP